MIKLVLYICLGLIFASFLFWKLWFSRMPSREVPGGEYIVSPANGKIVKIIEYSGDKEIQINKGYLGKIKTWTSDVSEKVKIVVIMMTPMNVHVQRASYDSTVISRKHINGEFLNAVKDADGMQATLENEYNEILFKTSEGWNYKVIQIAGFLARRIHDYVLEGQLVKKGDKIGFIDLGSQVVLIVPDEVEIDVKEGQDVVDGETIVGKYKN